MDKNPVIETITNTELSNAEKRPFQQLKEQQTHDPLGPNVSPGSISLMHITSPALTL